MARALIALLAAAVSFGTCDPVPTDWTITYQDGVVQHYSTPDNRLDLVPRQGRRFTVIQCQLGACSLPTEYVAEPLAGDANLDGCVGFPDYTEVGAHWGDCAP